MTLIKCSLQYMKDNPDRDYYILDAASNKHHKISSPEQAESNEVFVASLVSEEDAARYLKAVAMRNEAEHTMNLIKAQFADDCEAYDSVSPEPGSYSAQFDGLQFYVKQSTSMDVLDASELKKISGNYIIEAKPATFSFTKQWRSTISDILSGDYGDYSAEGALNAICKINGASPSTCETLSKKLRKSMTTNITVFKTSLKCTESEALDYAVTYDLAMRRDNIQALANLCSMSFDDLVAQVKKLVVKDVDFAVAVKVD